MVRHGVSPNAFTWTTTVDDISISLDATAIAVMVALLGVAAGLSVPLGRRVHPLLIAAAALGGVFVGLIAFANSTPAITATSVSSIAAAFANALVATSVVAAVGGALALVSTMGIATSLLGQRPRLHAEEHATTGAPDPAPPPPWLGWASSVAALVVATTSVVYAFVFSAELQSVGPIPRIESRGCAQVHRGLECVPRLKPFAHNRVVHERQLLFFPTGRTFPKPLVHKQEAQRGFDDAAGWKIPPVVLSAVDTDRGLQAGQSVALRSGIRVTRPVAFHVVDNTPDPRFSPEVGDAWRFSRAERHTRVHLFVFDNSTTTTSSAELRVTHTVVIDGKHAVVVTRKGFEAEASFVVAGVDGIAMFRPFGDDTAKWKRLIESEDAPFSDLLPGDLAQVSEAGVSACKVGFLPPSSCACFKHPVRPALEKAGPLFCHLRSRDNGLGTALLAVLTLGLVIEGTDRPVYTLISSGPHEAAALSTTRARETTSPPKHP